MALPARLTAALGRHPDELTEDDLQHAVDNRIPEGVDLDWKKDFYKASDAEKKELAKDVSAMANTVGGMVAIGVDDGNQDHAHVLAPAEPVQGRGEEWIRAILANWVQPVVPNVGVRQLHSTAQEGKVYWLLTVPPSPLAPHAVAAPGNDYHFRVHVRHGTTTRTLAESEIAQRYRGRFQSASDDVDRLHQVAKAGVDHLGSYLTGTEHSGTPRIAIVGPAWVALTAVPTVRGSYPLATREERNAAFNRFVALAMEGITERVRPDGPVLVGRRQARFEGSPSGQLHEDGSFYGALSLGLQPSRRGPEEPEQLYQRGFELDLVALVQAAAAWAAETGAAGDLLLSAELRHWDGSDKRVYLAATDSPFAEGPAVPFPLAPAQTTADLAAVVNDKREAVVAACALASDLLADMGTHQPHLLKPDGDIALARLDGYRHWIVNWDA